MKKLLALLILLGVMSGAALAAISDPVSSVISAGKYIYVPNQSSNQVLIYDTTPSPSTLKATINLVGIPKGLALSPDNQTLYIATTGNAGLSAYNATTGALIGSFTGVTLNGPRQVAVSPDGARVYLVDSVANGVMVYNASSRTYITSINIGVTNLYGIAVSPDNSMVAVTRRLSSGSVYIYSMTRDSSNNISGYSLKTTLTSPGASLVYPSFVTFSAQADRLFVRVQQYSGSPLADAIVYSGANFGTNAVIALIATDERDPNNSWGEGMTISANGQFLYLTHYRTTDSKVHLFRVSTLKADGSYRTSWPAGSIDATLDSEIQNNIPPSIDGLCGVPDGSRLWVTDSEDAYKAYSKWTGFTDGSGNLVNPVPGAPIIQHPASPDDMLNYTGNAQWTYASGDTHTNWRRYLVDYSEVGSGTWTNLEGYTSNLSTSLASLLPGHTYVIRVRMFGAMTTDGTGGVWGPFAYSQPFRMAQPTITDIKKGSTSVSKGYIYDSIKIIGTGFGTRVIPTDTVDDSNYNVSFSYYKSLGQIGFWVYEIVPQSEGTNARITSWTNTEIDVVIPRKFKGGNLVMPRNDYNLYITAFGISSNSKTFEVGPVITTMTPTSGVIGTTVDIYGAGLGTSQGSSTITFYNGVTATATIWTSEADTDHIRCTAPSGAATGAVKATVNSEDTYANYVGTSTPVVFTVTVPPTPTITKFQLDTNPDPILNTWVDTGEACVYDHIKIVGTGFGTDPGDASRATATNNVTIGGLMIRDDSGSNGMQVYTWSNTAIEIGVPRRVGASFVNAGANAVIVTANSTPSASANLNIDPKLYSIAPDNGVVGSSTTIKGTALHGSRTVSFDATSAGSGTITRETGDDPDGANGTDNVAVTVPASLTAGAKSVTANVNSRGSNSLTYTVSTVEVPTITKLQAKAGLIYVDTTEAIIYDTIRIVGSGFGTDPGDGSRDTATNNVTVGGIRIRDASGSSGLQVYSWSDTSIEIGLPRRRNSNFINAGANAIIVTAGSVASNTVNLNIKPHIYGISPNSGNPNITATVEGTALEGSRTIYFDATSAGSGTISRQNGDDPDGTNGSDQVTITVPLALAAGLKLVSANVNTFTSNNDVTFNVIPAGAPTITQIIPNVAPNTADINVVIKGTNFQSGATAVLKKSGQPDITGVVTFDSATKLTVKLPITGKVVGKWDVVVTNPDLQTITKSKGFTITDSSGEISEIIDDYEGAAVIYPGGYAMFPSLSDITFATTEAEKYEGDKAGSTTYVLSAAGYRGFNGTLTTMQDISSFKTLYLYVKSADASGGKIKVQLTDVSGKNFAAVDGSGNQKVNVPTSNATWTKYTLQLSDFVEIDSSGMPKAGGATLNKQAITNYQLVFTGNAASTANVYVDFVAAGGYTPPTSSGEVTTTIARAADTVGSAVTISWVYNDSYVGNADIYTVSGSWDAVTGVFTTDATKWTKSFNNVSSPQTDNTQVGQGTQKYYKVVKTGTALTNAMLAADVAGKFDIAVGPSDSQPERALISIPLVTSSTSLSSVFGSQPQENDAIAVVDNSFAITSGKIYTGGSWQDIPSTPALDNLNQGYAFVYTTLNTKYMTVVGKVLETTSNRTISGGMDASSNPALSWIGSALPIPAPIADTKTGLNGLSYGDSALTGAQSALIDANAAIIGNNYALHSAASTWVDTNAQPATLVLMPGRGYMLTEPTIASYSWTQSR